MVYVLKNSDAEDHVAKRFPNKDVKRVGNSLRPSTIDQLLGGMPLVFQPGKSAGLNATYHFTFTGAEDRKGGTLMTLSVFVQPLILVACSSSGEYVTSK